MYIVLIAVIVLFSVSGFARAQGSRGEIVKRPSNPSVHRTAPPAATRRSPRGPTISDQVDAAIEKGNLARDKAGEADSDAERKKQYAEAERQYRRGSLLAPMDPRPYEGLGNVFSDQLRYDDAIRAYKKAVELEPNWLDARLDLCSAYRSNQNYANAIEECKKAVSLKPDDGRAHLFLGHAYSFAKRYTEAIEEYKLAGPDAAEDLAHAYEYAGRYPEAIEAWKTLLTLKQSRTDPRRAHDFLESLYLKLGSYSDAIEDCKTAIQLYPADAEIHVNLGDAYYQTNRYPEAIEEFKTAVRLNAHPWVAHTKLGLAYDKAARYPEAIEEFKEVIRFDSSRGAPVPPEALYYLGLTYLKVNNKSAAMEQFEALKNMKSDYAAKLWSEIHKP